MKLFCCIILTAVLTGSPMASNLQAAADPAADAEWMRTVAAAKKEGKVSVFLYHRDNIETAVRVFEKSFPDIQLVTASTSAAETGPRLMAERRAGKFLWDICIGGPTTPFGVLYPAKALDPIKPALILPEVVDQSKWWEGKHHYMDPEGSHIFVFLGSVDMPNLFYNKNLVDPGEFKSYWDMVNAKWRGKIVTLDPRQPGRQRVSGRFIYNIPELGEKKSLRDAGIAVVNLATLFGQKAQENYERNLYIYLLDDIHWNAKGIDLAAGEILKQKVLD